MPKRISIKAAKQLAKDLGLNQVILLAWDGELTHIVTYGESAEDCDQAAQGGDRIKSALGWTDVPKAYPSRVKALMKKNKALTERLKKQGLELEAALRTIDGEDKLLPVDLPKKSVASKMARDFNSVPKYWIEHSCADGGGVVVRQLRGRIEAGEVRVKDGDRIFVPLRRQMVPTIFEEMTEQETRDRTFRIEPSIPGSVVQEAIQLGIWPKDAQ